MTFQGFFKTPIFLGCQAVLKILVKSLEENPISQFYPHLSQFHLLKVLYKKRKKKGTPFFRTLVCPPDLTTFADSADFFSFSFSAFQMYVTFWQGSGHFTCPHPLKSNHHQQVNTECIALCLTWKDISRLWKWNLKCPSSTTLGARYI